MTWAEAEALFPGCSVMWDAQGGPNWLGDRKTYRIRINQGLSLCGR